MAPRLLATLTIAPEYPRPLTQRDLDYLADLLSIFAAEMLKGEHRGGHSLYVHEPPKAFHQSVARYPTCERPGCGIALTRTPAGWTCICCDHATDRDPCRH